MTGGSTLLPARKPMERLRGHSLPVAVGRRDPPTTPVTRSAVGGPRPRGTLPRRSADGTECSPLWRECRAPTVSAAPNTSPCRVTTAHWGRHGLANRLRSTGIPTPNLSTLRWGRYGGWRSAGNREALPMPRCDPLQNLATSATPAANRQDRLFGSGPTGRSHRDGDALSKKWSVERCVATPARLATVGRYASCCCPGSFARRSPPKCPRFLISRTSLRRHGGSGG